MLFAGSEGATATRPRADLGAAAEATGDIDAAEAAFEGCLVRRRRQVPGDAPSSSSRGGGVRAGARPGDTDTRLVATWRGDGPEPKPRAIGRSAVAQRPVQERRHLSAGDVVVGAEVGVVGWVAAAGDAGCGEAVDVAFEDRVVVVVEEVAAAVVGVTQRPHQEGCHLSAGHVVVGAEVGVVGWVAAAGDAGCGEAVDVAFEDRVVVVV